MEYKEGDIEIKVCPKTGKEVLMQYEPGINDVVQDWLCLHEDTLEKDAIAVKKYRELHKLENNGI